MVHTTFKSEYCFNRRSSRQVELLCKREQCQACLSIAECSQQCEELSSNLYQVVIKCRANESRAKLAWAMPSVADIAKNGENGEDGEYVEYEIEADSHSEASAKVEALAADSFINIIYIEVYLIH